MSPILNSSNLVFATAMVVSSTAVILAFLRHSKADISTVPPPQLSDRHTSRRPDAKILRPCLSSGGKKERKKKKVQFAENVKKTVKEMEEFRKIKTERKMKKNNNNNNNNNNRYCRNNANFSGTQMPLNRVALYNGILRDRSNRMGFSY